MYCSSCGKEFENGASFCPYCGTRVNTEVPVQNVQYYGAQQPPVQQPYNQYQNGENYGYGYGYDTTPPESSGTATGALICAFIIPIVGLILGIIGTVKYKDEKLKKRCVIAIIVSLIVWITGTVLLSSAF